MSTRESASNEARFDELCKKVRFCTRCVRMEDSARVLSRAAGPVNAGILFIGEAPGRLGADESEIPFHGDQAGHNFEDLLSFSGLSRRDIFVTNAALCNPKDANGNNGTPRVSELRNCSNFLQEQLEIVRPRIVVTLGGAALEALRLIQDHEFKLSQDVRTIKAWNGFKLIPLYHPGQRALIHRSMANQRSDYQFVAEQFRKLLFSGARRYMASKSATKPAVAAVVAQILNQSGAISYFALHKLAYLVEYRSVKDRGTRLSDAHFLRQKDGPYCTDLQIQRLAKAIPQLRVEKHPNKLVVSLAQAGMFEGHDDDEFPEDAVRLIRDVVNDVRGASDAELKSKVYMTRPMRRMLKQERVLLRNMYNAPIDFAS